MATYFITSIQLATLKASRTFIRNKFKLQTTQETKSNWEQQFNNDETLAMMSTSTIHEGDVLLHQLGNSEFFVSTVSKE